MKTLLVGRHSGRHSGQLPAEYEIVDVWNPTYPISVSETSMLVSDKFEDALLEGVQVVLFQAVPAQLAGALINLYPHYKGKISVRATVNRPGARPTAVRLEFLAPCQDRNALGQTAVEAAEAFARALNPMARIVSVLSDLVTAEVDPPLRFELDHVEIFWD